MDYTKTQPTHSKVFSFDEKPNMQAKETTTGYVRGSDGKIVSAVKSTYTRHGILNLMAAMDMATGKVYGKLTETKKRVDFLNFLDDFLVKNPPQTGETYHIIMDNYCIHKNCDLWLSQHKNVVFHYTPTSSSWLNMIEIWFNVFDRKVLRGASFSSKEVLKLHSEQDIDAYNINPHPYVWHKREVVGSQIKNTVANLLN